MTPRRPELAVGGVAVVDGCLLLVQRANPPAAGRWSVPGGRVELGETVGAAVEREVAEETGLAVRCGPFLGWVERIGRSYHFVILDFEVELVAPGRPAPVAATDASAAAWVPLQQLSSVPLVAGLSDFLADRGLLAG